VPHHRTPTHHAALAGLAARVQPVDAAAAAAAAVRHAQLTKPAGSLGVLEALGGRLAAIAAAVPPPTPRPAAVAVFAADHGVIAEGVTPWPQEVTAQMVANFCSGGAAINVLAGQVGASITVVDVGVAATLAPHHRLVAAKVGPGTANLATGPAMTAEESAAAVTAGADVAAALVGAGARCLVTGEMGIGNTTASAALIAACTGRRAEEVTGRGTGIDDAMLARKTAVVAAALVRSGPPTGPDRLLAELGGLEIAALAGYCLAGAAARVPVVLDGVIALAAACVAAAACPPAVGYFIAGHRSTEPGASIALDHLGLTPLLDLGLRLGEGTGAVLALPLLDAAAGVLGGMATFADAGIEP
jgi:nicotinate-nucleotide--dimethylbenzimidazole phosphoribosyltransferase